VEDAFRISAAQEITLQIDLELLKEIKEKTEKDRELKDILKKLRNGERRDSQVALGLCECHTLYCVIMDWVTCIT
jgi:hypothetical protein